MNSSSSPQSSNKTLYIIDSYGLIYRSYYAFISRPLTNKDGENVSAVFGFFRNLKAVLDKYKPHGLVAAFDPKGPTFRHQMYDQYKATRQKTPEDLHAQVPVIEEILVALGIPVLRQDGFEADDVIATLAKQCCQQGRPCRILSADKDLMQLVDCTTEILKPDKAGGWEVVGAAGVEAEWGVPPEGMLDLLSLIGDTADNVPGVPGVGIKTALKLLREYGSLDGIYHHADEIKGAIGNKIRDGKDSAYFSKDLIALRYDVPLEASIDSFSTENLNYQAAADLLMKHGVPAVAKQYATVSADASGETADVPSPTGAVSSVSQKNAAEVSSQNTKAEDFTQDFSSFRKNTGNYSAVTDVIQLQAFIDQVLASPEKIVAFDCETDGLNCREAALVGFSLSCCTGEGFYIPLVCGDGLLAGNLISTDEALAQLQRLFGNKDCTVIMHNGKFDYQVLCCNGLPQPQCLIWDTMVAAWLLEPERSSYSLESLAAGKLGLETISFDSIVPKGSTFADLTLDQAVPYAAEDADLTWQLYQLFKPRLEQTNLLKLFLELEMPVLPVLAQMELQGIHIEGRELEDYGRELAQEIVGIKAEIYEIVGHEFNIASTKQLQQVLFEERGLPTGKKTKSGYSTDTSVLETLAALDVVPRKILEFRAKSKLLSTYVETLPKMADSQGRIHTSFVQTGTATGRFSSRDPNLQNIPVRDEDGRRIRSAFTATPGKVLISADYSQIELVLLAHLSQDEGLCSAFNQGVDVHKATAALIFGVPAQEVTAEMRRTAKTINFGVMYGMSAFRLSNELGIPRGQAQGFIEKYFATYAGISQFKEDMISQAEEKGFVETLMGRRRYIPAINSRNKLEKSGAERIAVNTPIQGSAADIVKKAMLAVTDLLKKESCSAQLLLQVHDELIFECDQGEADTAAALIRQGMESVVDLRVPLKVSVEIGPRWGDFH
ncbi:MAG: DNA polymerase I [Spirochaetia bacterium]|nr:DNA polymerase I [Spirochaetia bacterium]